MAAALGHAVALVHVARTGRLELWKKNPQSKRMQDYASSLELQGNLQGKAAMAAFPGQSLTLQTIALALLGQHKSEPFDPGQDPQRNSACFAQLMNVANLSGVAPSGVANPNPSSGDRPRR